MKSTIMSHGSRTLLLLGLAALYAALFWNCEMGLNLLLFDGAMLLVALKARPELGSHRGFLYAVAGLLFAAISVVIVHSPASMLAHHLTYLIVLGFAQARELRFLLYGGLLGFISLFTAPVSWLRSVHQAAGEGLSRSSLKPALPYLAAAFIAIPFAIFYLSGNEILGEVYHNWFNGFDFTDLSTDTLWVFLFMTFATLLTLGLLFPRFRPSYLVNHQSTFSDYLDPEATTKFIALPGVDGPRVTDSSESAGKIGVATFALLNVLLLLVNSVDLRYVWLATEELSAATLSHYVHVGTYNLIASVLLAIAVVLYFFRGSLSFTTTGLLRPLAIAWIAQNAVLLVSVGVRNYHYVDAYGLASGRVYVIFALALLAFGLYTLYRKVTQQLTLSYLVQTNSMALWLSLLLFGAVNWGGVITRYNVATQSLEKVDWDYLSYDFDKRNAFLLARYSGGQKFLEGRCNYGGYYEDWRGWNYSDWRNRNSPDVLEWYLNCSR